MNESRTLKPFVIIVSPDTDYLVAAKECIETDLPGFTVLLAIDPIQAIMHMHSLTGPAIFFVQYELPDMYGDVFIRHAKSSTRFTDECVLLTTGHQPDLEVKAYEAKALHFSKAVDERDPHKYNLGPNFSAFVRLLEERLEEQRQPIDNLTGAYTESGGLELWKHDFERSKKNRRASFGCIFADVNYLKKVNDTYGHAVGNKLLQGVVGVIRSLLSEDAYIIRAGGDEFVIILPGRSRPAVYALKDLIETELRKLVIDAGEEKLSVTVAMGVSWIRPTAIDTAESAWESLTHLADKKMYKQKETMKQSGVATEPEVAAT